MDLCSPLSPGKLSALKEIELCIAVANMQPSCKYYYMGYYIHKCPKMNYKVSYQPSELLCPVTSQWVEASKICDKELRSSKPQFGSSRQEHENTSIANTNVLWNQTLMTWQQACEHFKMGKNHTLACNIETYTQSVGCKVAQKMVFMIPPGGT